jgi:putative nucleotidyltransferase with HDIG domain
MPELARLLDDRLTSGRVDLPIFPSSASEIVGMGSAEEMDLRRLTDTVQRDPTLVAHVLRMANSPAFAPSSPVVSLPQAVARLGARRVCEMALFVICRTRAFKIKGRAAAEQEMLRHAIATAMFAQEIARNRRLNVEDAFLVGLMHDVGVAAVLQLAADVSTEEKIAFSEAAVDVEVKRLHESVGATIARKWCLPERVAVAIGAHHGACNESVALVQLADQIAHLAVDALPAIKHGNAMQALSVTAQVLNMYPDDLDAIFGRRAAVMAMVEVMA